MNKKGSTSTKTFGGRGYLLIFADDECAHFMLVVVHIGRMKDDKI